MGQVIGKGEVLKKDVTKFENHVHFDFIIKKDPIIVQGPNHLKRVRIDGRCGPELFVAAVSDYVTPNEALPHIGRQPRRNAKHDRCNVPALL